MMASNQILPTALVLAGCGALVAIVPDASNQWSQADRVMVMAAAVAVALHATHVAYVSSRATDETTRGIGRIAGMASGFLLVAAAIVAWRCAGSPVPW